ncbi:MAG: hypothetical protein K2I22_05345 [Lachnospiraceae bacterium]|nr:hypothetical protein [Lachnospiraceae bacterium]
MNKEKRKTENLHMILSIIWKNMIFALVKEFLVMNLHSLLERQDTNLLLKIVINTPGLRFSQSQAYIIIDRDKINREIRNKYDKDR